MSSGLEICARDAGCMATAIGIADGVCCHLDDEGANYHTAALVAIAIVSRLCMVIAAGDVLVAQSLIADVAASARIEALNLAEGGCA